MNYHQSPDELYHYGRLGMKWGQHIFGKTKTSLSDRKQRKKEAEEAEAAAKEAAKRQKKIAKGKMKPRDMTEEEIKQELDRLALEKRYLDTMREVQSKQYKSRGRRFVEKSIDSSIDKFADQVVADTAAQIAKFYLGNKINDALGDQVVNVKVKKDKNKDKDKDNNTADKPNEADNAGTEQQKKKAKDWLKGKKKDKKNK